MIGFALAIVAILIVAVVLGLVVAIPAPMLL
jgi:hypothetical protein